MKHVEELVTGLDMSLPWFMESPDPDTFMNAPYLVLDFETTNIEKGSALVPENHIVSCAWYVHFGTHQVGHPVHYHVGNELNQDTLLFDIDRVLRKGGFLVAHNAKFECQWLARCGLDLHNILVYCTQIGEFVLAGNRRRKLSLDATAQRYGCEAKASLVDTLIKNGVCPSEIPPEFLRARAIKDVKDTTTVFRAQRKILKKEGRLGLQWTRCIFTPVLADIETTGLGLDRDRVCEEYMRVTTEYKQALLEFNTFTGGVLASSAPQMAHYLYEDLGFTELTDFRGKAIRNKKTKQFPDGQPKTDDKTLVKIQARTNKQREFMVLRKRVTKLAAALSKTLNFCKGVVDEYGGEFFGVINQTVVATHRTSSSGRSLYFEQFEKKYGLQLQNFPNEFKDLIAPRTKGNKIAEADGSQLEFRGAAFVSQDKQAIHNIRTDVDQHAYTAAQLLQKEVCDVTSEERRLAKSDTFKPLYGGKKGTPEQERYYEWFRNEFSELAETQEGWTYTVLREKQLTMPWGMTFYFPYCERRKSGYITETPNIYNYPIQNLATGEIIPAAVTYLWHRAYVNDERIRLFNTIHDSAVAEIPPNAAGTWKACAVQAFTMDVYEYLEIVYGLEFNIPLGVGVTIGDRWSSPDKEEWEANVEPNGEYWLKGERL